MAHTQITMWTKPIATLIICIAQGAAANLFDADERVVVHSDAESPHVEHSNLFDAPGPVEEAETYTCRSIVAIAYAPQPLKDRKGDAAEQLGGQRMLRKKKKHVADEKGSQDEDEEVYDHQEEGFACELDDGGDIPIEATLAQLEEMRAALSNGTLISAVSTMDVDMYDIAGDTQYVGASETTNPPSSRTKSAKLPPGPIHLSTNSRRLAEHPQRHLNRLTGTQKLLVVRITDSEGNAPAGSAEYYSDKFFGTDGDLETPKSQLNGCSHGGESKSVVLLFDSLIDMLGMISC